MTKFGPDALLAYRYLSAVTVACGDVYFLCACAREDKTGYDSDLYTLRGGGAVRVTESGRVKACVEDGDGVIVSESKADGSPGLSLFRYDRNGTHCVCLLETEQQFTLLHSVPGGLIVSCEFQAKPEGLDAEGRCEILDEVPFWYNGRGFVNGVRNALYRLSYEGEMSPVTPKLFQTAESSVSPDGKMLAYYGMEYADLLPLTHELHVVDLSDGTDTVLLSGGKLRISCLAAANDRVFFGASDTLRYGVHENHDVFSCSMTGEVKRLSDMDMSIGNTVTSDCRLGGGTLFAQQDGTVYFIATVRDGSALFRLREGETPERLTLWSGSADCFAMNGDELVAVCMKDWGLQELYRISHGNTAPLTRLNTGAEGIRIPERMTIINASGCELDGYVISPDVSSAGDGTYPAILDIHGGPKAMYGAVFCHEMQQWAEKGCFVLFCNPTGSDGRGNEFADLRGKYGTVDYDDLMRFTDAALAAYPQIDPNRLYVTGGSYGGFMTNWIIGHTNRFRRAAAQRSISNWLSDFCMSDISFQEAEHDHLCTPWSDAAKLWFHSPLKYADKIRTPLLLIHSDLDAHCCLTDALQMLTAMKYHGQECRLCLFHGEDHNLSRTGKPVNRIRRLEEILSWFER